MKKYSLFGVVFFATILGLMPLPASAGKDKLAAIDHIVVIYLENHSFDSLFGTFPRADGLKNVPYPQIQTDETPYKTLPPVHSKQQVDKRFPADLPNAPFLLTPYAAYDQLLPDPVHRFYQTQLQIHDGRMDRFVAHTNVGALTMGYYAEESSPLWRYAKRYTLADNFFTAAFGGSLLNHFWLVCACTPSYPRAPAKLLSQLDEHGNLVKDGELTPDGYLVNNIQPFSNPYDASKAPSEDMRLPAIDLPTIGDRLSEKRISWAWYNGGWNDALAGKKSTFIPHHLPFIYFRQFAEGSTLRDEHLKDETDLLAAIDNNALPAVAFYKPEGKFDLHPGYSTPKDSEEHVFNIVHRIEQSPAFKHTLIIVTFDDSGGFYDHVSPPKRDRWGPGIRIPALFISPHVRRGYIDHTTYDTTSILKLIERKFNLVPLNDAYKNAGDLWGVLQ